jgi:hypothetical protein
MTDPLVRELLEWIAARPRTYEATMEAWRSHCPRQTSWEDACLAGLVEVVADAVVLTKRGRAELMDGAGAALFHR